MPEQTTAIKQNVQARKATQTIIELGITVGQDEGLDAEHVRTMWSHVVEAAAKLIGDQVLCDRCRNGVERLVTAGGNRWRPEESRGKRLTDDDLMPFGAHKDVRLGDVPDDYLDWLGRQDWIENHPLLLAYIEVGR